MSLKSKYETFKKNQQKECTHPPNQIRPVTMFGDETGGDTYGHECLLCGYTEWEQ